MTTKTDSMFEKKGNEVAAEVGRLDALTDELNSESEKCASDQNDVGSWITAIGKALLAIVGVSVGTRK